MKKRGILKSLLSGLLALSLVLGLCGFAQPRAAADEKTSSDWKEELDVLQEQNETLQSQIDALQAQRDSNLSEIQMMVAEKNAIDQQITLMYEQLDNTDAQIKAYRSLIADKQDELEAAQEQLALLNKQNRTRIRAMEAQGQLSYWSVIFKASSFSDLLDRLNMIREIGKADQARIDEMNQVAARIGETQAELEAKSEKAQELLSALIAKGEEFEALMGQLEDEQKDYADMLADKKAEYDEAKYKEYMATATQPTRPSGGGNGGKPNVDTSGLTWVIPCDYTMVSSAFGWRIHPIEKVEKFHNGVDLWAPGIKGKPIYATREGVVAYSGWYGSGGHTIKIDHLDGFQSIYMHMTNYIVKEGDFVTAGQVIGYVGSTGGSTGPHLHFEIRYDGTPYNPMQFIG